MNSRCRLLVHVALLLAAATVAWHPSAAAAQASAGGGQEATLCFLNTERANAGLHPVRLDDRLASAARAHSSDMVTRGYFAHVSPSGEPLAQRVASTGWMRGRRRWALGETLAWGTGSLATPAAIVAAWMRSPPHREIVLRPGFRRVGIGIVAGTPFGQADGATYTADFGAGRVAAHRRLRDHRR
jgi:uncharacterized protein YkwD